MKRILLIILTITVISIFQTVTAQNKIYSLDSTDMAEIEIPEIFVKSFKENTEITKLPTTVSLVSSKQIEQTEMQSVVSLTAQVANVFMPDYGSKLTSPIYIRGIGSRINSPSVGLYVDGVSYFEKAAFNFEFFDIDRIEVLKGPQGTLYGRNTQAGIINVITKSPIKYQGTDAMLSAGNYGAFKGKVAYYHKFSNKFGAMLGANIVHNNGYFTNAFNDEKVDKLNSYSGRLKLYWDFTHNWNATFSSNYEWSNQGGYPYAKLDSVNNPEAINYNHYSSYKRQMLSNGLNIKFENDNVEFHSVTSHQYYNGTQDIDQDFTAPDLYAIVQNENQNMFSEELILRSKNNSKYNWLFGAYGFVQLFDKELFVDFGEDYTTTLDNYTKLYQNNIAGIAFFHQSKYNITDNFTATAGIRFDYEADNQDYKYDMLMLSGTAINSVDTLYPELAYGKVLTNLALNYQVNDDLSVFVTFAQGYKTGSYNITVTIPDELTFEPENSDNYEVGVKSFWLDKKVNVNLSLFYINLTNQQIYQTVSTGRGSYLDNVGESSSRGAELEVRAALSKNFSANMSYGYTNATIDDYYVNDSTNLSGNYLPYVPKHTFFIGATYLLDTKSVYDNIVFNLNFKGIGKHYWNEENTVSQDFYGMLNGKITFTRGKFALDIWGKNLLNASYNAFYFEALGNSYVQLGCPTTYGINLKMKL